VVFVRDLRVRVQPTVNDVARHLCTVSRDVTWCSRRHSANTPLAATMTAQPLRQVVQPRRLAPVPGRAGRRLGSMSLWASGPARHDRVDTTSDGGCPSGEVRMPPIVERRGRRERLERIAPELDGKVLAAGQIVDALEALIVPGDRVALEGNNQEQADFRWIRDAALARVATIRVGPRAGAGRREPSASAQPVGAERPQPLPHCHAVRGSRRGNPTWSVSLSAHLSPSRRRLFHGQWQ
jgi:malonate decarboxylase alpha subunit